jgi:hypothetical protein
VVRVILAVCLDAVVVSGNAVAIKTANRIDPITTERLRSHVIIKEI